MNNIRNPEGLREIKREIVSGLIFSLDNKLLMGMKHPGKGGVYPDRWHLSGGGQEKEDATLQDTLVREVREETSLDISGIEATLIDNEGSGEATKVVEGEKVWCQMHFNIYSVTLPKNASELPLVPTEEFAELRWFDLSEIEEGILTPPSVELFKRLGMIEQ